MLAAVLLSTAHARSQIQTAQVTATSVPAVSGWNYEGEAVGDVTCSGGGTNCMSNSCSASSPTGYTSELEAANFQNLSLPANAVITAVEARFYGGFTGSSSSVRLRMGGSVTGTTNLTIGSGCASRQWDITSLAPGGWTVSMVNQLTMAVRRNSSSFSETLYLDAFKIVVSYFVPPANDIAHDAVQVVAGDWAFDNTYCTTGPDGQAFGGCGNSTTIKNDLWYVFFVPQSGWVDFSTCGITSFDTKIAVYADRAATIPITCNDDTCGGASYVRFFSSQARGVWLQVGSSPSGAVGAGAFRVAFWSAPSNDQCESPVVLQTDSSAALSTASATNTLSGQSGVGCDSGNGTIDRDLWYRWQANYTGQVAFYAADLLGDLNTKLAVYDGTGCVGTRLACNDSAPGRINARAFLPAVAGNWFTVQAGAPPGAPDVSTSLHALRVRAENEPATAATATGYYQACDTTGATSSPYASVSACGQITRDIWLRASSSNGTLLAGIADGSTQPVIVELWSVLVNGEPGRRLACSDGSVPATYMSTTNTPLLIRIGHPVAATSGSKFIIRVDGLAGSERRCTIDIASIGGDAQSDSLVSVDDLVLYLGAFFSTDLTLADTCYQGGAAGRDGQITVDDLVFYLNRFFVGCP